MSIFGDETITPPSASPEAGQEANGAVDPEHEEPDFNDDDPEQQEEQQADPDEDEGEDESEDEPSPDDGQGGKLILGKFKSQDELARAYLNLQRQFTQERQRQAQTQNQQSQLPAQQPQAGQPDLNQVFWERFKTDPIGAIQAVALYVAQQQTAPILERQVTATVSQNLAAVAREYRQLQTQEGMKQLYERVAEIAEELGNPQLAQQPTLRVLRMAASELWGDTKAQVYQKAKQAGRAEAERTRQAKQGLGVQGVAAKRQPDTPKTPEQEIMDGLLSAAQDGGLFG